MKILNLKLTLMAIFCYVSITSYSYAQQGTVTINQDKNIDVLLNLKKEINKTDTDYYKIQIYSGSHRSEAEDIQSKFNSTFSFVISIALAELSTECTKSAPPRIA